MYSFDPVGSYERERFRAGGSAAAMLQPLLDNQVNYFDASSAKFLIVLIIMHKLRISFETCVNSSISC